MPTCYKIIRYHTMMCNNTVVVSYMWQMSQQTKCKKLKAVEWNMIGKNNQLINNLCNYRGCPFTSWPSTRKIKWFYSFDERGGVEGPPVVVVVILQNRLRSGSGGNDISEGSFSACSSSGLFKVSISDRGKDIAVSFSNGVGVAVVLILIGTSSSINGKDDRGNSINTEVGGAGVDKFSRQTAKPWLTSSLLMNAWPCNKE